MSVCLRICIDDLCRGNRDNTICGGSYCDSCDSLTYEPGRCDSCRDADEENEIESEEGPA